jgi:hypothetical protein
MTRRRHTQAATTEPSASLAATLTSLYASCAGLPERFTLLAPKVLAVSFIRLHFFLSFGIKTDGVCDRAATWGYERQEAKRE